VTYNMAVVRRRFGAFTGGVFTWLLSLQGSFPLRLRLHLPLCAGWCSWIPFVGLLLVGRSLPVMRLAYVSSESRVCLGHSTVKQHDVLLMGFKFEDSLSNRESAESFIWIFFIAGDGGLGCGSDGRRWRRALDAPIMDSCVILFSFRGTRSRAWL
jgi:hypothetical protein